MGMAKEMKNLSDEILASYKKRLQDNEEMIKEVQKTLDGFRNDQMEMAATLKANAVTLHANIAKGQKERIASFDVMINGIRKDVKDIQISTSDLLKGFDVSHHEMAGKLSEMLAKVKPEKAKWNSDRLKKFEIQMKGIQDAVANIFDETDKLLKKFDNEHLEMSVELRAELKSNFTKMVEATKTLLSKMNKEHQEMAKALRKDLSQNDAQRLKDFNVMFTEIQKRVNEIEKYVNKFLTEFSTDRKQAADTWAKMAEAIATIKKSFDTAPAPKKQATTPKKQEASPVKPVAVKEEAPIEVVAEKEIVIEEEVVMAEAVPEIPEVKEPQKKELTLEDKVLNYINSHKNGVKVSDMEAPFGESRMRLGFITKKLLDEGKVQKTDNLYFPIT
jgi:hypothetical protein